MIIMPFTYSISNGIGAGIITYVIVKLAKKKYREISWVMYLLAIIFAAYFIWLSL